MLTLFGLRNRASAISASVFPSAISCKTWNSRSDNVSYRGWSALISRSKAKLSARVGLTYLPPLTSLRMALTSSPGAFSFVKYPAAPAFRRRTASLSSAWMLSTRTGSLGWSCFNSFKMSNPLRSGILISSTSTSQPPA